MQFFTIIMQGHINPGFLREFAKLKRLKIESIHSIELNFPAIFLGLLATD
jgi:hypothetical protein